MKNNMKECEGCGNTVAVYADKCPNCGAYTHKSFQIIELIFGILTVSFIVWWFIL